VHPFDRVAVTETAGQPGPPSQQKENTMTAAAGPLSRREALTAARALSGPQSAWALQYVAATAPDATGHAIAELRAHEALSGPVDDVQAGRWAALREHIRTERAAQDEIAADQAELGHDWSSERAYGRVEALDQMMAWMDREDGTS